ncbi:uncharacterized protein LOC110248158 [Paramuricea clavata]|uniref:Uncharacterized protein LOC110248158 n=1 Tax=Paramuricea clavata TaxID=317549 RepID=A0A6S7K099_PARCT|nr:uncharacterized protein LOC110248158 [Paramuricea clavata]
MTIPRLELTAAELSVCVSNMLVKELVKELDVSPDDRFYWTDSTTLLKYFTNDKARYKTFVANRVQTIRDTTAPHEWHYVDSALNPADDASRGLKMSRFLENKRWINGPSFLWKATDEWPKRPADVSINTLDDPEVAAISANTIISGQHNEILEYFSRFSQWYRLKKAIAWLLRMKPRQDRNRRNLGDSSTQDKTLKPIMVEELEKAEVTIVKIVQAESFPDEISVLKRVEDSSKVNNRSLTKQKTTKLRKSSSLYRLDPFLGSDGLLCVGGRLRRCDEITTEMKHPVILPKNGHVTELIIGHNHENAAHGRRGITLNHLRGRYWIINANSRVRNYISRCVDCRKFRARTAKEKMADLPKDRLTSAAPYTYCGVDLLGPCLIKDGRKELKRYGVLFICLNSRAIHLESANSLETDSFLNTLRRFIARRGPVGEIRSDRGTNLIGAAKELKDALKVMDDAKINLCAHGI